MTSPMSSVVVGFAYPHPGLLTELNRAVELVESGPVKSEMLHFVGEVGLLELGEWEELHTRTVDLSPLFVPYVGHITWGESYRRGAFMAELQGAQMEAGVDQHGELPDHIVPILEYLDRVPDPLPELVEVLPRALAAMRKDLAKAEPDNPYRHLLSATAAAIDARLTKGATT